jgi:hypothetical protein
LRYNIRLVKEQEMDAVYIAVGAAFFVIAWILVGLFARLQ